MYFKLYPENTMPHHARIASFVPPTELRSICKVFSLQLADSVEKQNIGLDLYYFKPKAMPINNN